MIERNKYKDLGREKNAGHRIMIVVVDIGVIIVIVAGRCGDVASILLCIDVMDLLVEVNTGCISPAMLADAMAKHYAAHVIISSITFSIRSTTVINLSH